MGTEIFVNIAPKETRVAVVEGGQLQDIYVERTAKFGLVGSIYKGTVVRVLPGMQAAFVEIGLERAAFIHVSDMHGSVTTDENGGKTEKPIHTLLHEGQPLLVQVIKDPLGSKGARLTTQISIPSRYMVFMPNSSVVGISQRIEDEEERVRLRAMVEEFCHEQHFGFIVRTVAEDVDQKLLYEDMSFLRKLWTSIVQKVEVTPAGTLIHGDMPLAYRVLRDMVSEVVDRILIDSIACYERGTGFASEFLEDMLPLIEYYSADRPMFDMHGIEDEIQKALERKVQLKSGGHLVIDQTEAMTTIDVNTGGFVGHRNLEETIFKTNLEAAQTIARQLRLRNIGGIIILDFIDMLDEEHKRQVLRTLERHLANDHSKCAIYDVSPLGLVEMTRKRTRESLEQILCQTCPSCSGRGHIKSPESVCYEIFRELIRENKQYDVKKFLVIASTSVVNYLLDDESDSLAELEAQLGVPVNIQGEVLYNPEQFDVVLV
jgi:ribonuclease G